MYSLYMLEEISEQRRSSSSLSVMGVFYLSKGERFISAINQLSMHAMHQNGWVCIRYA